MVLTDNDLLREMYNIFPYARQHNGKFPQELEPQIRKGALKMIVFEELVYQDAQRRGMTVSQAKLDKAVVDFRKQFKNPDDYKHYVKTEGGGSEQALRAKIRRSLLIDQLLRQDVQSQSVVTVAQAKAYYDKNPDQFRMPESFAFQTISVIPPDKATPAQLKEARKRAEDAAKQAKATKDYETFGVLAEKISEDDYRVVMGDHRAVERAKLPPEVVKILLAMQPGQVSDLLEYGGAYQIIRLNAHIPAGMRIVRPGEGLAAAKHATAEAGATARQPGQEAAHQRQGGRAVGLCRNGAALRGSIFWLPRLRRGSHKWRR